MDQLKVAWVHIQKHYFWILSSIAFLTAVVCWFLGTTSLQELTQSRKSTIESKFAAINSEKAYPAPLDVLPNDDFVQGISNRNKSQAQDVLETWRHLYEDQRQRVMIWPAGLAAFKSVLEAPAIREDVRNFYNNYVQRDEPKRLRARLKLLEVQIPQPMKEKTSQITGFNPMGGNTEVKQELVYQGIVCWPNFDQIFAPYKWIGVPSTLQVKLAQEDIWVYTALFDAIAATNADADDYKKAKVKRIDALEIGKNVSPAPQPISSTLKDLGASEGAGGDGSQASQAYGSETPASSGDGGQAVALSGDQALKDLRYITLDGKRLKHDEASPHPEFRLMPVHMVLLMDQRRLPALLQNCARSNLPLVVNFQVFPATQGGTAMSGGPGSGSLIPGAASGAEPGEVVTAPGIPTESDPNLVTVDLRGYAVIYEAPNPTQLQGFVHEPAAAVDPNATAVQP